MESAKEFFPPTSTTKSSTTRRLRSSLRQSIVHTFVEAVILVTLVVFIFLQNLQATLIPLLTVPVSLIGRSSSSRCSASAVNTLSMFGLVLAIGIVVDDAIVVVEAVMHHTSTDGPRVIPCRR
jgi:HAE1 family hydrophobic/amphiphilic exporter-1